MSKSHLISSIFGAGFSAHFWIIIWALILKSKNKNNKITKKCDVNIADIYESDENAYTATKGIFAEDELDEATKMFFSSENMDRIQKMIKRAIYEESNGKYKLEVDQDEMQLLIMMREVFFDGNNGARHLPQKIKRQVDRKSVV